MEYASTYQKQKTRKQHKHEPAVLLRHKINDNLALSAGTTNIKSRDPIYHITESFKSTFDLCGQYNAGKLASMDDASKDYEGEKEHKEIDAKQERTVENDNERRHGESRMNYSSEFSQYESTQDEKTSGNFYRKFSDIAFQNGRLASAVLHNGGKTMFLSCVKRALGHSAIHNSMQTKLFSVSSNEKSIRNSSAKVIFNDYVNSAVGLVVDSIHSARQTLEVFERVANNDSTKAVNEMNEDTLRTLYPFLDISQDRKMLAEYSEKLKELNRIEGLASNTDVHGEIANEKAVLTAGIVKTQGLITKKNQMKSIFLNKLSQLLENSRKAEAIFTSPSFSDEIFEEFVDILEEPEDNGDDKPEDDGDDKKT